MNNTQNITEDAIKFLAEAIPTNSPNLNLIPTTMKLKCNKFSQIKKLIWL
jgi:hypothetical protein